jgi:hypothetical protein
VSKLLGGEQLAIEAEEVPGAEAPQVLRPGGEHVLHPDGVTGPPYDRIPVGAQDEQPAAGRSTRCASASALLALWSLRTVLAGLIAVPAVLATWFGRYLLVIAGWVP